MKLKKLPAILFFIAAFFLFSSEGFAAVEVSDPDLKLSIEELKKKYPISLLAEKSKNYKPNQKINIADYSNAEIKAAFLNADKNFKEKKSYKKIVQYQGKETEIIQEDVIVFNPLEMAIIEAACDKVGPEYYPERLPKKLRELQSFLFSDRSIRSEIFRYVSPKASDCLDINDPLHSEDRD